MYNEKLNYENATGPIEYGMTVDYMFRVVLQKSKPALKGLVMSILRLQEEEIDDVVVLNPINPGEHISDKEIRMDVRVLLNDDTKLDLEMQVKNNKDWPERSVVYLCREFDSLSVGEDYEQVKSIYQIGFLDFNLFDDHPEFCGRYQLRNEKDGYLYSSKLNLCVVQLNHTELATDEDRAYGIDKWAKVFKASTWEELKMVAQNNEFMSATAESIFLANQDYNVRKVIRERQEHEMYVERLKEKVDTLEDENASLRKLLEEHGIKAP
ncbi:MAG: Rpn family recombination-promoting nuclease/putative transposase [Butyrivibrio sp.]|nr:Rpn family recombination-promoting nuclease/putative transposase [Butyrivibrio sp.]